MRKYSGKSAGVDKNKILHPQQDVAHYKFSLFQPDKKWDGSLKFLTEKL